MAHSSHGTCLAAGDPEILPPQGPETNPPSPPGPDIPAPDDDRTRPDVQPEIPDQPSDMPEIPDLPIPEVPPVR